MRKIQKIIGREEMISRIPSLFPFYRYDGIGNFVKHRATDSAMGSYGNMMSGMKLPVPLIVNDIQIIQNENSEDVVWTETVLLEKDTFYSYRTLMNMYHKYKNATLQTVSKSVGVYRYNEKYGRIDTSRVIYKTFSLTEYEAYKDMMYSKVGSYNWLYDERNVTTTIKLRDVNIQYNGSEYHTEEYVKYYELNDYEEVEYGNFIKFIDRGIGKIYISEAIEEYNKQEGIKQLDKEIVNLPRVPSFVYLARMRVSHDEMVKLRKTVDLYQSNKNELPELCCEEVKYKEMGGDSMVKLYEFLNKKAYEIADEYFNIESCIDKITLSLNLYTTDRDMGYMTPDAVMWKPGMTVLPGSIVLNTDENGITNSYYNKEVYAVDGYDEKLGIFDFSNMTSGENPHLIRTSEIKWYKNNDDKVISGNADSKLPTLRCYPNYINVYDSAESPSGGEDWLFHYKKGEIIDYDIVFDENGNMTYIGDSEEIEDGYVINLNAYGSLITDIELDFDNKMLTFKYVIDAHLKKKNAADSYFEVDEESKYGKFSGLKYVESYYILNTDEWEKIKDSNDFEDYITKDIKERGYEKYPFNTNTISDQYIINVGTSTGDIRYLKTEFTKPSRVPVVTDNIKEINGDVPDDYVEDDLDTETMIDVQLFKEEYLMGVEFKPSVINEVKLERGVSSAMERHLRLGEVKTLADMEDFQNGSFFNIKNF